jgi:hypothetical protein
MKEKRFLVSTIHFSKQKCASDQQLCNFQASRAIGSGIEVITLVCILILAIVSLDDACRLHRLNASWLIWPSTCFDSVTVKGTIGPAFRGGRFGDLIIAR